MYLEFSVFKNYLKTDSKLNLFTWEGQLSLKKFFLKEVNP
jgi:hypothetical protein